MKRKQAVSVISLIFLCFTLLLVEQVYSVFDGKAQDSVLSLRNGTLSTHGKLSADHF
jgi:hypothetical protein